MRTQEWTEEMLKAVKEMNQIAYNQVEKLSMSDTSVSNLQNITLTAKKNMHISEASARILQDDVSTRPHF